MLVLSRRKNESVFINDNIKVMVVEVINGKVRLGFECPPEVKILRSELRDSPPKTKN